MQEIRRFVELTTATRLTNSTSTSTVGISNEQERRANENEIDVVTAAAARIRGIVAALFEEGSLRARPGEARGTAQSDTWLQEFIAC